MIASALGFTAFIVLAKVVSEDVHPAFIAFMRAFIAMIVLLPWMLTGHLKLKTYKFELLFSRSVFGSIGFIFSMLAVWDVFNLPLAEYNALSFTRSLFVTIFAAIFLRELVGAMRWGAVLVGFLGVLIMAVPEYVFFWLASSGGPMLNLGSLFAILSAVFLPLPSFLLKNLTQYHKPIELLMWANILSSIMLLIPALMVLELAICSWLDDDLCNGLTGLAAQFCYIKAMSIGDASFLSPMDYLRCPWRSLPTGG